MNTICVQTTKHWRYYLTSTRKMSFRCNINVPHNKTFIKNAIHQITFWWILYCLNSCCSWFFLLWHDSWWWSTNKTFFYFRFHKFSTNQKCNCRSEELFIAYLESTTQSLAICYFRNIFCYFQIYLHLILQQQRWQRRIGWPSFVLISYTTFLFS